MEVVTNSILGLGPGGVIISMKEPFKKTRNSYQESYWIMALGRNKTGNL